MDLTNIPEINYSDINEERMEIDPFYKWKVKENSLAYLTHSINKVTEKFQLEGRSTRMSVESSVTYLQDLLGFQEILSKTKSKLFQG
jgi:hypothetical protein